MMDDYGVQSISKVTQLFVTYRYDLFVYDYSVYVRHKKRKIIVHRRIKNNDV